MLCQHLHLARLLHILMAGKICLQCIPLVEHPVYARQQAEPPGCTISEYLQSLRVCELLKLSEDLTTFGTKVGKEKKTGKKWLNNEKPGNQNDIQ